LLEKKDGADPAAILKNCAVSGVKVHFFCMFGFPGTGEAEAEETIDFVLRNQDLIDTIDVFPWCYAKHTSVPGVQPVIDSREDLALEYSRWSGGGGVLGPEQVLELAGRFEDQIWREVPRFLHPTYRLISPWLTT
jgi:hypothetical protein